ncbi:MAG: FKBP-type peptidyl-prolyl cis-trans isomerase [Candidatus Woesearchaeota archaeon]|nr:FKBP-type peptidyl-prolyl cis-trans isomerase [Candidatus Woesearchaeota archaeon]
MAVKKGDKVKVEYTGTLEDGTVFDSSEKHNQPLEFEVGSGQIIQGLDKAIIGMKKDEEKEVKIKPEQAYGQPNPELVRVVPKEQLPLEKEPKKGMVLIMALPNGQQMPVTITKVSDKEVTLDLNHPLAGKTLNFKVKIIEVA